jgi:hypothetical protein
MNEEKCIGMWGRSFGLNIWWNLKEWREAFEELNPIDCC